MHAPRCSEVPAIAKITDRRHLVTAVAAAFPVLIVGLGLASPSRAQVPPAALPDVRLEGLPPITPPPAPPALSVPQGAPATAPPGAKLIRFRLANFTIDGVSAYPPERFRPLYESLLGQEVSLADLYQIAADIQKTYRDDGYFLTRVIVPEQTITDGQFRIQVIEGFINRLQFEGDVGAVETLVRAYMENVTGRRPIRLSTLEHYLLLANDIPGVSAQGILRPSRDEVGAAELVVRVGRKPFDALVVLDNYGTEFSGLWQGAVGASTNAFTRFGEQVSLVGLISRPFGDPFSIDGSTDNQWVTQAATSWRIGSHGLFVEALASYGVSRPGFVISQFDFETRTLLVDVAVGFPFHRSRDISVVGKIGFDWENLDTDIFNSERFTRDRSRVLYADAEVSFRDGWRGSNAVQAQLRQGVPLFNATKESDDFKSRPDATNQHTAVTGTVSRLQPLISQIEMPGGPASLAAYGTAGGQYAIINDVLVSELFDVGMTQYGRGYDLGEISGDHGIGYTAELQLTHRLDNSYVPTYQLFVFYDAGYVWNRSGGGHEDLSSAGGGIRISALRTLSIDVTVAKPISKNSERSNFSKDPQVLFRAVAQF